MEPITLTESFFYLSVAILGATLLFSLFLVFLLYRRTEARKQEEIEASLSQRDELFEEIRRIGAAQELKIKAQISNEIEHHLNDSVSQNAETQARLTAIQDKLTQIDPALSKVGQALEDTRKQVATSMSSASNQERDHQVFAHAIRLAKEKADVNTIVEICGINRSEAELIIRMHGGGH